jgi:circadian clock protein KaiB
METSFGGKSKREGFHFRLFVVGDEPNSEKAKDNLEKLCGAHVNGPYKIEIVDVLESYQTALENNIFLTPALIRVSPAPSVTIFGNLSNAEEVAKVLQLEGDE